MSLYLSSLVKDRFHPGRWIARLKDCVRVYYTHELRSLADLFSAYAGAVRPKGIAWRYEAKALSETVYPEQWNLPPPRHWVTPSSASYRLAGSLSVSALLSLGGIAFALPQGYESVEGNIQFQQSGSTLNVTTGAHKSIAEYQQFNVGQGETVNFNLPNAQSAILNRVVGPDVSQIMGKINSNGQVFLANPNGIVFGQGAQVNVVGLLASTLNISNQDFMAGQYTFKQDAGKASAWVKHQGQIATAPGGFAILAGGAVENTGNISSPGGSIHLAVGKQLSVNVDANLAVQLTIDESLQEKVADAQSAIHNTGNLSASRGGTVKAQAKLAENLYQRSVNNTGHIEARGLGDLTGTVLLQADSGQVNQAGSIDTGNNTGKGGTIEILGHTITLSQTSKTTANGQTGGGEIYIGGDYQGQGNKQRARITNIEANALIQANAQGQGNGGRVIVWSDEATRFNGLIEAKGGILGGNGGLVETSSKGLLGVSGLVDASATHGQAGEWLLDPSNVVLVQGSGNTVPGAGGTVNPSSDTYQVDTNSIQAALNAGSSVTITTANGLGTQDGNITTSGTITIHKTSGGDATLTLKADNSISLSNTTITSSSNKLNLVLWSDSDNSGTGDIRLTNSAATSNGGHIVLGGGLDDGSNGGTASDGRPDGFAWGTSSNNDGIVISNSSLTSATGQIMLKGKGLNDPSVGHQYGISLASGSIISSTSGNITLHGVGGDGTSNNYGILINDTNTGITSATGAITITGQGGNGSGNANYGIRLSTISINSTGTNALGITLSGTGGSAAAGILANGTTINSEDGNIVLIGLGSNVGSQNHGVSLHSGTQIVTTGNAGITVQGTGGNGTDINYGIYISTAGTLLQSVNGNIQLIGQGGHGSSGNNYGIRFNEALIQSLGTGAGAASIQLLGTGGNGTTTNVGVLLDGNANITSIDGTINIEGTGGNGSTSGSNYGLYYVSGNILSSGNAAIHLMGTKGEAGSYDLRIFSGNTVGGVSATGNIIITANDLVLANSTVQTAGNITIKPRTAGTSIGIMGGAGTLNLSNTYLSYFNPGSKLVIGDSTAGSGLVTIGAWDLTGKTYSVEVHGGTVDFTGAVQWNQANDLLFHSRTGDLAIDRTFTKSGGGTSTLTFKAGNTITQNANISSSSGALNTILWSDADNSGAGAIILTNTAINSNGGDIILAGGLDDGANDGIASDGRPDNTAWGTAINDDGIRLNGSDLTSGAGQIRLLGHGENAVASRKTGVILDNDSDLTTTTGSILIRGIGGNGTDNNYGVWLNTSGVSINTSSGTINISGTGGQGNGDWNIGVFNGAASISSTGTGGGIGNITITGVGGAGGNFAMGIRIVDGTVSAVDGSIHLTGTGGGAGATYSNYGVHLYNTATLVTTTGTGNILINGTGGTGTSTDNTGIYQNSGVRVTTVDGNITYTGTGGSNGSSTAMGQVLESSTEIVSINGDILLTGIGGNASGISNYGIAVGARIATTGTGAGAGNITLIGTGGTGTSGSVGLRFGGALIETVDGDITLQGQGGNIGGSDSYGLDFYQINTVRTTGTGINAGNIALTGTGGSGGGGNSGIKMNEGASVYTLDGTITLQGAGGTAGTNDISLFGSVANTFGNANQNGYITLVADRLSITNTTFTTAGNITIKPRTAGTSIGIMGGAGTLNLSNTYLSYFNPGSKLVIGDSTAGSGLVTIGAWDLTGKTYGVEVHGGTVDFTGGIQWNQANNLLFHSRTGDLVIDQNFSKNGGGDATLTFKAAGSISNAGTRTIISSSGKLNTILWSDSDNNSDGSIFLTTTTITSNGGDVILAGGLDDGANSGIAGDDRPDNYAWGSATRENGIDVINFSSINAGSGNIVMLGHGRNNAASASQRGVYMFNSAVLQTTGEGNITIKGVGGNGTSENHGLELIRDSIITTLDGDITISGTGGNGSANGNSGIYLHSGSSITTTGTGNSAGNITLIGTGGTGGTSGARGVSLDGTGGGTVQVSVVDGDINITGTAGTGSSNVYHNGFGIGASAQIRSTGIGSNAGNITITGYAGSVGGSNAFGIAAENGGSIQSADGDITIIGNSTSSSGIYWANALNILTTGDANIQITGVRGGSGFSDIFLASSAPTIGGASATGNITINADTITFGVNPVLTTAGSIIFKPRSAATTIGLHGGGGSLNFSSATMAQFNPGTKLIIGDSTSGTGTVTIGAWDLSGKTYSVEVYGGTINFTGAVQWNQANNLLFHSRTADLEIDHNFTKSGGGDSTLTLKAAGSIYNSGVRTLSSSSGKMNIILWSDSDNSGAGSIKLTNSSITSNGGYLHMAGGLDDGSNGGTAADGRPDGFAWGTTGRIVGVDLWNSVLNSQAGNILIRGRGQNSALTTSQYGVLINNGSVVQSATGNIAITGIGGSGTDSNYGIYLSGSGSLITSQYGAILLTGQGQGSGTLNYGITINASAMLTSTGTGANAATITLHGTGTMSGTNSNHGIALSGGSTAITSINGNINLTGIGGNGSAGSNIGIYMTTGSDIVSSGTGVYAANITLNGTGGTGSATGYGVHLRDSGTSLQTVDGNIAVTGQGGHAGSSNHGIYIINDADILSANNGKITLLGTGGNSNVSNYGIGIHGVGTSISSVYGNISLTGQSGITTANANFGLYIDGSSIVSSGTGNNAANIVLAGTGGSGTFNNHGVYITANASLSVVDGDLTITGQGGAGNSTGNTGILINAGTTIYSTGTTPNAGRITLQGTGGAGSSGQHGLRVTSAGTQISSAYGDITLTGQGGTGSSTVSYGLYIDVNAVIQSTGTGLNAAKIILNGTGGSGTNNHYGVLVSNAAVTTVDGNILLTGQGGNGSGTGMVGIYLTAGALLNSTGTGLTAGRITLNGTGGSGTSSNHGIYVSGAGTTVSSAYGNIQLTGQGATASANANYGIYVENSALIQSTGTGNNAANITLTGTGGTAAANNYGIYMNTNSSLTTIDGDITLAGFGGNATGIANTGIYLNAGAALTSTGSGPNAGNITLTGTAGPGSNSCYGIQLNSSALASTLDGNIRLVGSGGGNSATGHGVRMDSSSVYSTGTGNIALTATNSLGADLLLSTSTIGHAAATGNIMFEIDDIDLTGLTAQTLGNITIKPLTANTSIGIVGGSGMLGLTNTILGYFQPGNKLIIGDNVAGTGTVTIGAWDLTGKPYSVEVYGGTIDFTGAITWNQANNLLFHSRTGNLAIDQIFAKTGGATSHLTLKAAGNLIQGVDLAPQSGSLHITLQANTDGAGNDALLLSGLINSNGGNITLQSPAVLTGQSTWTAGTGHIGLSGSVNGSHNLTISTSGAFTLGGPIGQTGALATLTLNAGTFNPNSHLIAANHLVLSIGNSSLALTTRLQQLTASLPGSLTLQNTGNLTLHTVSASQLNLTTSGAILDGNGSANNLLINGNAVLHSNQYIGLLSDALDIQVLGGTLSLFAESQVNGVSANIAGVVTPGNTLTLLNTPPGIVIFNGLTLHQGALSDDQLLAGWINTPSVVNPATLNRILSAANGNRGLEYRYVEPQGLLQHPYREIRLISGQPLDADQLKITDHPSMTFWLLSQRREANQPALLPQAEIQYASPSAFSPLPILLRDSEGRWEISYPSRQNDKEYQSYVH